MNKNSLFNILVVDDDPDLLLIAKKVLQSENYMVRTAGLGQDCLQAIRQNKPHLLLLDVMLPDINGVEICKIIKSDPGLSSIYILLLSGMKTDSENVSEGLETGADGYLIKPIKNRELLARTEAAFRIIRAELALQDSVSRFRLIADNSPILIWQTNSDNLCDYVNQPWLDFTGHTLEQELGTGWPDGIHPDDAQICLNIYQNAFIHRNKFSMEYRLRRADGEYRWLFDTGVPRHSSDGTFTGFIGSCIDITDRKHSEDTLAFLNSILEERVAKRTKQLETINQELEFHLREIEQFTFIASHDLQEPLVNLNTFTELLKEEYSGKLDENGNNYIEFISVSATRMSNLVKGLLDYSFLGKGSVKTNLDLNIILSEVLRDLHNEIEVYNAKITVTKLPVINGYYTELKILLHHLISNGIKYHNAKVRAEIKIYGEQRQNEKLISIKDNGIGIPDKNKEKIFIIFKRLHNRGEYSGIGIGLAHCKKIVELHGGKIWVEDNEDFGSTLSPLRKVGRAIWVNLIYNNCSTYSFLM
jgi:PAS domain S-box-containing protein